MDIEKIEFLFENLTLKEQLQAFEILTNQIRKSVIWEEKMKEK